MQTHDAELLRAARLPTVAVTVVVAVVAGWYDGSRGVLGAVLGGLLVATFFGFGHLVSSYTARISPPATLGMALLTYTLKVTVLGVLLVSFRDATSFSTPAFGAAVLAATVCWLAAEVRAFTRLRMPYVQVSGAPVTERHFAP